MSSNLVDDNEAVQEFLIMKVSDQFFGIPVINIRDVLTVQEITPVPLAPKEILGLINLRGRIVTALDIRVILKIAEMKDLKSQMSVVVEYQAELYSLIVDGIHEVIKVPASKIIHNPDNLSKSWKDISVGIYPQSNNLVVIMNIDKLLHHVDGKKNEMLIS